MSADTPKAKTWHSTVVIDERLLERRAAVQQGGTWRGAEEAGRPLAAEGSPPEMLEPGTRLGRYLIIGRLGGGGMGVVYKAQDPELERTVALKVLPPHLCRHPEYLARFRAEARANARLGHPNVVTLYAFLELPVGEVLVLEYIEGQTLEQRLRSEGPLAPQEAVRIFEQVLRGVEHIHARGVIHRDLKPGNIFLARDGTVKLMDFGVARILNDRDLGQRGTMVGTLLYIAPEQINGRETDCRSDIYTLGISLFEAVTGRLPFERRTDYALMHAHVQEAPPRPRQFQRRLPPALEWVILKAIEKEPDRRFQSASEFREALLKIGLVERRCSSTKAATTRHADSEEGLGLWRQAWRRALAPDLKRRRWLGMLWLDVALVAAVFGLVFALGLYPAGKPRPSTETPAAAADAVTAKPPKTAKAKPAHNAAAAERRTVINKKPSPSPVPPGPAEREDKQDKYDALREAWGGGG
jgi:serine/threonine-protein kinase